MRAKSLPIAAFLGAASALIVAGCGGGGTETSSIVSAPTTGANQPVDRASFIRQANAICSEANGAISSLPAGTADSSSVAGQASIVRGEVKSLQSLGTPASGKRQLNRYVAALDDLTRELLREKQAIDSGGDTSVAATAVASAQSSAQSAARALGARECAGSTSPSGSAVAGSSGGTATTPTTTTTPVTPTTPVPTTTPVPITPTTPAPPPSSGGAGTTTPGGGTSGGGSSGGIGVP